MKSVTFETARRNFGSTLDQVCMTKTPVTIKRPGKNKSIVLLPLGEYNSIEETAYLMRSPSNARRLLDAMDELSRLKSQE
jgi:antitoxin YefM